MRSIDDQIMAVYRLNKEVAIAVEFSAPYRSVRLQSLALFL